MKLERRLDHIKVLESDSTALGGRNNAYQCINCKERYQLIPKPGDTANNLFCLNCGHSTPIRTIKHSRSLIAPSIQQQTALVQSQDAINSSGKHRRPKGINRKPKTLEQDLISKGFQVIDSQTIEPSL